VWLSHGHTWDLEAGNNWDCRRMKPACDPRSCLDLRAYRAVGNGCLDVSWEVMIINYVVA